MECKRCLLTDEIPGVTISSSGQCSFCDLHDSLELQSSKTNIDKIIEDIKRKGRGRKYDCIIGISGGFDSSFLLHMLTSVYSLRTLAFHFDNGWNGKEAEENMKVMVEKTGADFITFKMNNDQLNELNLAFLRAGVSDADIPNDMAMSKLILDIAEKYDVKTIINGHNYRYEGSAPIGWSYMDAKYIQSVANSYDVDISSYPILTFWEQIKYMLKGYKSIRLLYYIPHDKESAKKMLSRIYGWKDYGGNHGENIYTEFVGNYLLPLKFGINKKLIYASAELRSGIISREEAIKKCELSLVSSEKLNKIEEVLGVSLKRIMLYRKRSRKNFASYHDSFKRWKFLIYLGTKLDFFPVTFYKKYCN